MKSIFTILQDFEKLIYKILMWVILIPKTIVKITLNPSWAHDYITAELNPEHKPDKETSPFDEYMSPVILLLVVAFIPALVFSFLPTFGATLGSPAEEKPTTDRFLAFESLTDFKSSSTELDYFHIWTVEKVQADGSYAVIYREDHFPGEPTNFIELIDNNTVKDRFLYTFPDLESGEYYIDVYAGKFYPWRKDAPIIEVYNAYLKVTVPVKLDEQVVISNDSAKSAGTAGENVGIENIVDQIQKENTIFLALALMIPPLLFALATKLFMEPISENTLKENFYVQCYYFSPLSLAIWATYYAYYFFTSDAYFYIGDNFALPILLLPPIIAAIWFFRTEMKTMIIERQISGTKPFLIVTACITVLGFAVYVFFYFSDFQDRIRLLFIQAYPVLSAALLIAFGIAWYGRRQSENKRITIRNLSWVVVSVVALFAVMRFISFKSVTIPEAPVVVAATQVAELPAVEQTQIAELPAATATLVAYIPVFADTPTPVIQITETAILETPVIEQPTAVVIVDTPTTTFQPFYTEEFNGDIASWTRFMTSGDERMVQQRVEFGKLSIDLLQLEEKLPWFYLINNDYTYSDVKVEAVVTNRGINANGISIICRYSDIGWYEFLIQYSGFYSIYAVDTAGIVNQGYNEIANGGSTLINSGLSTNVFTAECRGSDLNFYVNQTLVRSITDTQFNFSQGKIGIAVTSPEKKPVSVDFETLTISEP